MSEAALMLVQVTGGGMVTAALKLPTCAPAPPLPLKVSVPPPEGMKLPAKRRGVGRIVRRRVGEGRLLIPGSGQSEAGARGEDGGRGRGTRRIHNATAGRNETVGEQLGVELNRVVGLENAARLRKRSANPARSAPSCRSR